MSYSSNLSQQQELVSTDNGLVSQEASYVEKINNFSLQAFDTNQKLRYFIQAKQYINFKNMPALLLDLKVTTYDKQSEKDYTLSAQRGNYFDNNNIKFVGKVDIRSHTGLHHKVDTQALVITVKTQDLTSHKQVTYLGEGVKIVAQGMHIKPKENKIKLIGKVNIQQDNGTQILTKTLYIDESNGRKHYYSNNNTAYIATQHKIYADSVDMNQAWVKLFGKVTIVDHSGSRINTKNLIVDQSKNNIIYRTKENIHYQSNIVNIYAKGMHYNVKNQKIKLTGGVIGRYE